MAAVVDSECNRRETKMEPAVHETAIAPNTHNGILPRLSTGCVATPESEPRAIAETLRRSAALGLNKLPMATIAIKKTETQTPPQNAKGRVSSKWPNQRHSVGSPDDRGAWGGIASSGGCSGGITIGRCSILSRRSNRRYDSCNFTRCNSKAGNKLQSDVETVKICHGTSTRSLDWR